jgi:hypothetical protein
LLPFPKRTATGDEVELTDEDFVLVDEIAPPAIAVQSSRSPQRSAQPASASRIVRASALPPGSRRVLDEQIEEDVAGQCLASIAIATRATSLESRHLSSSSHIRAALEAAPPPAPPGVSLVPVEPASESRSRTGRLPSISAPPFVRTSSPDRTHTAWPRAHSPEAPGIRDSAAPPAFIRRSSPAFAQPLPAFAQPASSSSFASVAPVSMSALPPAQAAAEPTVILVRERPRSIWILAAAAVGALGAIAAMRFAPLSVSGEPATSAVPHAATQPAPVLAPPSTAVVLPVAAVATVPAPASAPAPAPTVMHFSEAEGVAIKAPVPMAPAPAAPRKPSTAGTTNPAAAPATRPSPPRAPSMGPALPDGSFGLGRSESTTASAPPSPPPSLTAPAPAPEPPRKRALTPEQQLAEAQLKASMK